MAGLEVIGPDQLRPAWQALAASFDNDPMFRFLLPEEGRRRRTLEALMALAMSQCVDRQMVFAAPGGPSAGAISLVGPGDYPPPQRLLRFAARRRARPPIPWLSRHLLRAGFGVLRAMEAVHYPEPHLYVMVVGVHPDRAGQGLGRALMEHACQRADDAGVPCYLETSNEVNLGFYRRFGFELANTLSPPHGAPPVWTMLRSAGA